MKVKTYKYESLEEGLDNIKQELGSNALILSARSVSVRKGFSLLKKPAWEITAAVGEHDGQPPELVSPPARSPVALRQGRTTAAAPAPASAVPLRDDRIETLINGITDLKRSFRTLSKVMPPRSDFGGLFTELISQGIDHDLADQLLSTASSGSKPGPREIRERVRELIAGRLTIAPAAELQAKTRLVTAFLGSTGVGKTTTVAKIAGHAAFKMKKKVALISTDMRIGGQEPLMQFGELLSIPAYGCPEVARLKELVANLADRDLILIDTPGSSPSDLARLAKLEELRSGTEMKVHLVISAATRSEDVAKIVMRFDRFKPNSVIFTKIDETDSKGPVTGDLLRNNISVSYVTNGQRVPDDLMIPTAEQLAHYVLPAEPVE